LKYQEKKEKPMQFAGARLRPTAPYYAGQGDHAKQKDGYQIAALKAEGRAPAQRGGQAGQQRQKKENFGNGERQRQRKSEKTYQSGSCPSVNFDPFHSSKPFSKAAFIQL